MSIEMTAEPQQATQQSVEFYPLSSAGAEHFSLVAFVIVFLVFASIVGALVVFWNGRPGYRDNPFVAAAASAETTPPPAAATNPPDMNTLAPQFGAWLLKHPELNEQTERVQGMMRANQQQIQNLCASLTAVCSQAKGFDSVGACKNRPAQCAQ